MKNKSGCIKPLVISIFLMGVIVIAIIAYLLMFNQKQQAKIQKISSSPQVYVSEPVSGVKGYAGSHFVVIATGMGAYPIVSMEVWIDGERKEVQNSERAEGSLPFYAVFDLIMPDEGEHAIFVRAQDNRGGVAQRGPVALIAEAKPKQEFIAVFPQQGETVEEIAASYNTEPNIIQALNPALNQAKNIPIPADEMIKIPALPKEGGAAVPTALVPASPLVPAPPLVLPNIPPMQNLSVNTVGILSPVLQLLFEKTTPPVAPTGLQAEVKDCKLTLHWQDNADNEESYALFVEPITRYGFVVPFAKLKPSTSKGESWYEFQSPAGGSLSIWVEAVNAYGSTPSNIVWSYVMPGCPHAAADKLHFTLHDMTVSGAYDKTYCYVSFDGLPEQRIPWSEAEFLLVQGGKAQKDPNAVPIGWGVGDGIFDVSIDFPKDGVIDFSGECWGLANDYPSQLGTFSASFPAHTWNGQKNPIDGSGGSFQMHVSLKIGFPFSDKAFDTNYFSSSPTIPVPYDLVEVPDGSSNSTTSRILRWKWDGDIKNIKSFEIFLNGKPYSSDISFLNDKTDWISYPRECDINMNWQVAAKAGAVLSNLSAPLKIELPPCKRYLRVKFERIHLKETDDGFPTPGSPCETLDVYYRLSVRDISRSFYNDEFTLPLKCGIYYFEKIGGGSYYQAIYGAKPHVFTIPLAYDEDASALWIRSEFWDSDPGEDDKFMRVSLHPDGAWQKGEIWQHCSLEGSGGNIDNTANSTVFFTYALYPNRCHDIPPTSGSLE